MTAALLAVGPLAAHAQVSKFSYTFGVGAKLFRAAPSLSTTQPSPGRQNIPLFSLGLSFDAPLRSFGPERALGLVVNPQGGIFTDQSVQNGQEGFTADVPLYLTWRYGAKATKKSAKTCGVGLGGGLRSGFVFWGAADHPMQQFYASPSLMLEGVYSTARRDYYLRLSGDVVKHRFSDFRYVDSDVAQPASLQTVQLQAGLSL
ncbi:hypothetical protein GCM10027048_01000 [Hymenobacter coalescens]